MINFSLFLEQIQLNELGNAPYTWTKEKDDKEYIYTFDSEAGQVLAMFVEYYPNRFDYSFTNSSGSYKKTGTGDEFKIMSTITAILVNFINEHDPEILKFDSAKEEGSRGKLYSRVIKSLLRTKIRGYDLNTKEDGRKIYFTLVKK